VIWVHGQSSGSRLRSAENTIYLLTVTARSLCRFFSEDRLLDSFTAGDAEDYRKWLLTKGSEAKNYKSGLGDNTARRMLGRTKQFFGKAVKRTKLKQPVYRQAPVQPQPDTVAARPVTFRD